MPDESVPTLMDLIDELARAKVPLKRMEEEVIEPARLDDESRSALWLHAWHHTDGDYHPPGARRPEHSRI